jgi:hypothetical protein
LAKQTFPRHATCTATTALSIFGRIHTFIYEHGDWEHYYELNIGLWISSLLTTQYSLVIFSFQKERIGKLINTWLKTESFCCMEYLRLYADLT